MHCSHCEGQLDAFVDDVLPAAERTKVSAHVEDCPRCRELLDELRCIDALLMSPRQLDPAANFTFKVMAEVRSAPAPHRARLHELRVVLAYLAFAWTIIGAWVLLGGASARDALQAGESTLAGYGGGFSALASATTQLFGSATSGVTALMGIVVVVDVVAAVALIAGYAARGPRLAKGLARISETRR
jgi:anti-sigma factor RsiW